MRDALDTLIKTLQQLKQRQLWGKLGGLAPEQQMPDFLDIFKIKLDPATMAQYSEQDDWQIRKWLVDEY